MKTVKFLGFTSLFKQNLFSHKYCTGNNDKVLNLHYKDGLPYLTVPLPSRKENCLFILRPVNQSVGDLMKFIKEEDLGIDRIAIYSLDGQKISKSNSIFSLLSNDFNLVINENTYRVPASQPAVSVDENVDRINDLKNIISQLSVTINCDEFNMRKEQELKIEEEKLLNELSPLEEQIVQISMKSAQHTRRLTWLGLGAMGIQFGLLARLTWWEYSWDIMEPVTYFVGYGTTISMYAYYIVTRQEYCFPQVFDREYLKKFYSVSKNLKFDVDQYNDLKDRLAQVRNDIKRLRDPLLLNLPLQQKTLD